jgi:hypothetical protein
MKSPLILLALAGTVAAAPQMTERITPEEIAARHKSSPMAAIPKPNATGQKSVVARPGDQSLIEQSDVLNDGINWTLVPKGAVLHVPQPFTTRVGSKPLGTLLSWSDFLKVNRNWLFTEEVLFEQAAGKRPIPPSRTDAWNKLGKVVVAVHRGGPISVRHVPEPATPVASTP